MQLLVDQRNELVERLVGTPVPDAEELCNIATGRRLGCGHLQVRVDCIAGFADAPATGM